MGLKWVTKIRILGVFFSNGLLSVDDDNWNVKLNKLSSILGLWKQRDLSFIVGSLIVNVLGASHLWHVANVSSPPPGFMINLNQLFGLLFGMERWKMLAVIVVVRQLRKAASASSILMSSV